MCGLQRISAAKVAELRFVVNLSSATYPPFGRTRTHYPGIYPGLCLSFFKKKW